MRIIASLLFVCLLAGCQVKTSGSVEQQFVEECTNLKGTMTLCTNAVEMGLVGEPPKFWPCCQISREAIDLE